MVLVHFVEVRILIGQPFVFTEKFKGFTIFNFATNLHIEFFDTAIIRSRVHFLVSKILQNTNIIIKYSLNIWQENQ